MNKQNPMVQKISELCKKDYSRKEISQELQIPLNHIDYYVRKYNIPNRFKGMKERRIEKRILEEYKIEKVSMPCMARKLNISYARVRRVYDKYNLEKVRSKNKQFFLVLDSNKYENLCRDLKNTDKPYSELSKIYGVSRQRICEIKKKENIVRLKNK